MLRIRIRAQHPDPKHWSKLRDVNLKTVKKKGYLFRFLRPEIPERVKPRLILRQPTGLEESTDQPTSAENKN